MTNERAAEILNPTHYEDYDSLETVQEACRMGMVALKMQIPEVPLAPGAIFDFTCPHCGSRDYLKNEDGNRNKFCGQCGKALDWEEVYAMKNDAVFNLLPEEELLAQLAEECSEAAKAALKLRRARDGVNPTPASEEEAFGNLVEELADIYLCSIVLFGGELDDDDPCNMCDDVGDNMVEIMELSLIHI